MLTVTEIDRRAAVWSGSRVVRWMSRAAANDVSGRLYRQAEAEYASGHGRPFVLDGIGERGTCEDAVMLSAMLSDAACALWLRECSGRTITTPQADAVRMAV